MVGWHHRLNGLEFEQTLGDSEEQGNLACCSSWGHKESDTTQQLNNKNYTTSQPKQFSLEMNQKEPSIAVYYSKRREK